MDIKSKEARSRNMSKIKDKNTKPEVYMRSVLHTRNFRFRVNYKNVEGCPDVYFTKKKVALFVHGCFWHQHNSCKYSYIPKSNLEFWQKKFTSNQNRDKTVQAELHSAGVRILVIWECTVKRMMRDDTIADEIIKTIVAFIQDNTTDYLDI